MIFTHLYDQLNQETLIILILSNILIHISFFKHCIVITTTFVTHNIEN